MNPTEYNLARNIYLAIIGSQVVTVDDAPKAVELSYALAKVFLGINPDEISDRTKVRVLHELIARRNKAIGGYDKMFGNEVMSHYPELERKPQTEGESNE